MLYPVYIHIGDEEHANGVIFPDFPGCFSAADEWEDLPTAIQEAVKAHFAGDECPIPSPRRSKSWLPVQSIKAAFGC